MTQRDTLPAPVLALPQPPDNKWERERQAFLRMLPDLLTKYRNQYVAVHEGQIVGSGDSLVDVAMRAYAQFGYVPIYVDLVTDQPPAPVRLPSPRLVANEGSP